MLTLKLVANPAPTVTMETKQLLSHTLSELISKTSRCFIEEHAKHATYSHVTVIFEAEQSVQLLILLLHFALPLDPPLEEESCRQAVHGHREKPLRLWRVDIHSDHLASGDQGFCGIYLIASNIWKFRLITWFTPHVSSIPAIILAAAS